MTTAKPVQGGKGKARERVLAGESVAALRDVLRLSKVVLTITRMMRERSKSNVLYSNWSSKMIRTDRFKIF